MTLDALNKFDEKTANGILAAVALSTASSPGIGREDVVLREHAQHIDEVLSEIRRKLNISKADSSAGAQILIDQFLTKSIKARTLGGTIEGEALARAGQAGRLPPALYSVEQPLQFARFFHPMGAQSKSVIDAVNHPDDYQHLMNELTVPHEKDTISLFMKKMSGKKGRDPYWFLVQAHRIGMTQVAQSAWRVYPTDIDLSGATEPLDVLRSFVAKFGEPILLEGKAESFVEFTRVPKGLVNFGVINDLQKGIFESIAWTDTNDPDVVQVGIGYSVNTAKYRTSLKLHGITV